MSDFLLAWSLGRSLAEYLPPLCWCWKLSGVDLSRVAMLGIGYEGAVQTWLFTFFGHWKCPNREWGKGHFSKYKRNENLRPILNRNIPLISGKYGLRNQFCPLESVFLMRKSEKKGPNSKFPRCPIFKYFMVTREVICQKMAPILDPVNFFGFSAF